MVHIHIMYYYSMDSLCLIVVVSKDYVFGYKHIRFGVIFMSLKPYHCHFNWVVYKFFVMITLTYSLYDVSFYCIVHVLSIDFRNSETLIHMLKGSLGTGILAMPNAFYNSGLLIGTVGTLLIGILCTYCLHVLVSFVLIRTWLRNMYIYIYISR